MSNSSRWHFGCGKKFTVYVPKGYDYKPREVECGSTAYDGGVNQCPTCAANPARDPGPIPEYGDDIPEGREREPSCEDVIGGAAYYDRMGYNDGPPEPDYE
jgi:hypothetical protein